MAAVGRRLTHVDPDGDPVAARAQLQLLGGFSLWLDGRPLPLPVAARRLVALLALRHPTLRRRAIAILWPDADEATGQARLRTAVWQVTSRARGLVCCADGRLSLPPWLTVDVAEMSGRAMRLVRGSGVVELDLSVDGRSPASLAADELLPEWSDDWVADERERLRQLQLHALEALAAELIERGRYAAALDAALTAAHIDPLRESAYRVLIQVHLAEGNTAEAVRRYEAFRALLLHEVGVDPSPRLRELLTTALVVQPRSIDLEVAKASTR